MEPKIYMTDFQDICFGNPSFFVFGKKLFPDADLKRKNIAVSVLGKVLLKYAFLQEFPDSELPELKFSDSGKPFFETEKPFHFNISHTGNRAVVASAPFEIGVDVEFLRKCNLEIAARFFNPKEYGYLKSFPAGDGQDVAFTQLWTMKESCVKLVGTGISNTFDKFSVDVGNGTTSCFGKNYYFKNVKSEDGCFVSLCTKEKDVAVEVIFVEVEELLRCLWI